MKRLFFCTAYFVTKTVLATAVVAGSSIVDVTPENISGQPLVLRIETRHSDDGTVVFDVFVSSGRSSISPRRAGRLEIAREAIVSCDRSGPLVTENPSVWCNVRETKEGGTLQFSFGLARDLLPRASFEFQNFHPSMPAMDAYRLCLDKFVPAER